MGAAVAAVGIGAQLIGAGQAASAARRSGRAARAAAEFDAGIAEQNAERAMEDALDKRDRFLTQFRMSEGTNRASIGKSGIAPQGSITDVLSVNASNAARDAAAIEHQGELRQQQFLDDAASLRRGGRAASAAAGTSASAQLLSGAGGALTSIGRLIG